MDANIDNEENDDQQQTDEKEQDKQAAAAAAAAAAKRRFLKVISVLERKEKIPVETVVIQSNRSVVIN
jgi:hypothetical protein